MSCNNWETCVVDDAYEICDEYPYQIRRKRDGYIICEFIKRGYYNCHMNDKSYLKHRVIALQWLSNDDPINKTEIDHINRIKTDNRLKNLRWVSRRENMLNRSGTCGVDYKFVDELPDDAIEVNDYGVHSFEFYYYAPSTDLFYFYNGVKYRELHVNINKNSGTHFVHAVSINGKKVAICYNKFKKLYDLI